ncbi:MAG: DUF2672 domain-containing protein [Candidatus Methanofastidiosa archaeon]|nr:DUF2672 domain-containing protein [Candidatus Methanofastidiosa archaeon]
MNFINFYLKRIINLSQHYFCII